MITHEGLMKIYKQEMGRAKLAEVPSTFYEDCRDIIRRTTEAYKKTLNPLQRRLINNYTNIIAQIQTRRYEKIVYAALNEKTLQYMVGSEKNLYHDIKKFNENKENITEGEENDTKFNIHYSR